LYYTVSQAFPADKVLIRKDRCGLDVVSYLTTQLAGFDERLTR
jgi:hypothetical protein